jgi:ATP-dependent 26S proteasome regulatory subunit
MLLLACAVACSLSMTFAGRKNKKKQQEPEPIEIKSNVPFQDSPDVEEDTPFEEQAPIEEMRQEKVRDQFAVLEGGNTCGYHALKNGLVAARWLLAEGEHKQKLQALFTDAQCIDSLCAASDSTWRSFIIKRRAHALAASFLRDMLLKQIKGAKVGPQGTYELNLEANKVSFEPFLQNTEDKEAERAALQDILVSVAQQLVQSKPQGQGTKLFYTFTKAEIIHALQAFIAKALQHDTRPLQELASNHLKIEQYFPTLADITFCVEDDDTVLSERQEQLSVRSYNPLLGKTAYSKGIPGEWLETEEIKALYAFEKGRTSELLHDLFDNDIPFYGVLCIENPRRNPLKQQFATNKALQDLSVRMQDPLSSFVAVVILHAATVSHWFTLVIKKEQTKTQYIFADSAGNASHLKDLYSANIIKLLKGEEILEQSYPSASGNTSGSASTQPSSNPNSQQGTGTSDQSGKEEEFANVFKNFAQGSASTGEISYSFGIPQITIEAIIGIPAEIARTVQALLNPNPRVRRYAMLLYGPSGTGKTTIAKALAGSTKRELFLVSSANVVNQYQGSGAQTIRMLFAQAAKANQPVIVFVDEIDLITGKADSGNANARSYEEARIALMAELDKKNPNIFFIAATNHLENIDPTIKSRLDDYTVKIDLPTRDQKKQIFAHYAGIHKAEIQANLLDQFADLTEGISGRQIEKIVEKAVDLADLRDSKNFMITDQDWYSALYFHDERMPQQQQREEMLMHFAYMKTNIEREEYKKLAEETAGLTGRQIEEVVRKASELAKVDDLQMRISLAEFYIAIHELNPRKLPDKIVRQVLLAHYLAQGKKSFANGILEMARSSNKEYWTKWQQNKNNIYETLSLRTDGFTGQQLKQMVTKALKAAAKQNRELRVADLSIAVYRKNEKPIEKEDARVVLESCLQKKAYTITDAAIKKIAEEHLAGATRTFIKQLVQDAHSFALRSGRQSIVRNDLIGASTLVLLSKDTNGIKNMNLYNRCTLIEMILIAFTRGKALNVSNDFFALFASHIRGKKKILSRNVFPVPVRMAMESNLDSRQGVFMQTSRISSHNFEDYDYMKASEVVEEYTYELYMNDLIAIVGKADRIAGTSRVRDVDFYVALQQLGIEFDMPATEKSADSSWCIIS